MAAGWRTNWRTAAKDPANRPIPIGLENRRSSERLTRLHDSFISAEGVDPDWSELAVTGDDTLVDVSHEEKCLQNKPFSVEHFTK